MTRTVSAFARGLVAAAASVAMFAPVAPARAGMEAPLAERLTPPVVAGAFPGVDAVGAVEGSPPIARALRGDALAGYLFSTADLAEPAGYSGEPFDIVVGLGLDGRIAGTALLEHYEPMIGPELIPEEALQLYLDELTGMRVDRRIRKGPRGVDGVSGATISSTLMAGAVLIAGRRAAQRAGLAGSARTGGPRLDAEFFEQRDWDGLFAVGAVTRLRLTDGDAARAFGLDPRAETADGLRAPFLEFHVALATPADIGRNLFGARWHNHHLSLLSPGDRLLWFAAAGRYPILRRHRGGGEARLRLIQAGRSIPLPPSGFLPRSAVRATGAPRFDDHALFRLPAAAGLDPLRPWAVEIAAPLSSVAEAGSVAADPAAPPAVFTLAWEAPRHLVAGGDGDVETGKPERVLLGLLRVEALSDWQRLWVDRAGDIAVLAGLLAALTLIFALQDRLARRRRLHRALRTGFLAFVLVWLGWMQDAQLTTLNVLTYARAALGGVDWRVFLVDPLILILSAYVGLSLVLWGRGVFCGWLCPFGALQELTNRAGRLFRIPQLRVPETLQEKLWALKYVAAAALCATAAYSMDAAGRAAEIEPFKTAIVVMFDRGWVFVAWALALLAAGLFVERFFCRFLCPLGGVLTLLGKFHLVHWLKRRPECGNPCAVCRSSCPIGAIAADGAINENECLQCLDCQVDYYDDTVCPPLVARRRRLAQLGASPSAP